MSHSPTPSPAQRIVTVFGWIIASVQRSLARNAAGLEGPVQTMLYSLIGHRLRNARDRLVRLAERVAAGWVYQPKPRPPRKVAPRTEDRAPRKPNPFTTGSHWAIRAAPGPDAGSANNSLYLLLEEPEVAAVLAAAPGPAWRILRPVCVMLGVAKPTVLAKLDPRPPRAPKPGKPVYVPPPPPPWEVLPPDPDASYYHRAPSFFWPWIGPKPKTA
jgi:hypothetical protein